MSSLYRPSNRATPFLVGRICNFVRKAMWSRLDVPEDVVAVVDANADCQVWRVDCQQSDVGGMSS